MCLTRAEKRAAMYRRDAEWRNTPRGRAVSSSRVSPFGWFILSGLGAYLALMFLGAFPTQSLMRVRLGIAGESTIGQRVTLTASLPSGYGLITSERRAGWPALNPAGERHASLSERFTVELPRALYCVFHSAWTPPPPPPATFVLRLSDAPAEEYYVWSRGGQSGYHVRVDGIEMPPELAAWKLDLGPFERVREEPTRGDGPSAAEHSVRPPLWLLRVRFERKSSSASPTGSARACRA